MSAALQQEVFSAPFSLISLKADRPVFGKLVGAATDQLMTPREKRNSNHCVNMSTSELTPTILGIAQIVFTSTRHENSGEDFFLSAVVLFCSRNLHFVQGNRDIFCKSVHKLVGYFFKCCLKSCQLWVVTLAFRAPDGCGDTGTAGPCDSGCNAKCVLTSLPFCALFKNPYDKKIMHGLLT